MSDLNLGQIRERLELMKQHVSPHGHTLQKATRTYIPDVSYLIEEIERLKAENERLKQVLKMEREGIPELIERTEKLKAQNANLLQALKASLYAVDKIASYDEYSAELCDQITQAIRKVEPHWPARRSIHPTP